MWLVLEMCFGRICRIYSFLCNKVIEYGMNSKNIYFQENISKEQLIVDLYSETIDDNVWVSKAAIRG